MKNPNLRLATAAAVTLFTLVVAACTPTQNTEQTPVRPATTAEITRNLSGNSASSNSGGAYYASNGSYQSFYYLSETPNVCTGKWRAKESKLIVKETCKSVSDGKTVSGDSKTSSYAVYVKPDGAVRLDEQLDDPSTGQRDISKPVEGFPRKAEFTAMQEKIESGKAVKPGANPALKAVGIAVGVPLWLAMCISTAGLLCI